MADINPYQAPQAPVRDPQSADGPLTSQPRTVDAGRGLAWLAEGWAVFRQAPLIWIALSVIGIIMFLALALVPIVGQMASTLLSVLFAGGIMLGCRSLDRGGGLTVGHLFAGFQTHLAPLLVIGALYLSALFLLFLLLFLVGGGATFAAALRPAEAGMTLTSALVFLLLGALIIVPLTMAIWFSPGLVALHDVPPLDAMKLSFRGCVRNILPFLVYGLIAFILAVLATIPFGLGWLVLLPMLAGSVYAGYKDIFLPD